MIHFFRLSHFFTIFLFFRQVCAKNGSTIKWKLRADKQNIHEKYFKIWKRIQKIVCTSRLLFSLLQSEDVDFTRRLNGRNLFLLLGDSEKMLEKLTISRSATKKRNIQLSFLKNSCLAKFDPKLEK